MWSINGRLGHSVYGASCFGLKGAAGMDFQGAGL